jgi:hypothetical protein
VLERVALQAGPAIIIKSKFIASSTTSSIDMYNNDVGKRFMK